MDDALDTPLSGMLLCITNTSDILLTQLIGRVGRNEDNFNARKGVIARSI
jgi:hypothetical protein